MNITGFIQCLSGNNFQSGNLVAYYDFSQKNSAVVFNQLYATGQNYSGTYIDVSKNPGLLVGTSASIAGQVSTKIGNSLSVANIHCLFDVNFSGCQNTGQAQATILLTSRTGYSEPSGFVFGINSSNRLFFENSGGIDTLNAELRNKNVISFCMAQDGSVDFGYYDFVKGSYVGKTVSSTLDKSFNDLYLINYWTGSHTTYSGLMGNLNTFAILNDVIGPKSALTDCLFCTGINYASGTVTGTLITISGVTGQNIYISGVTGYQQITTTVVKEGGTTLPIVYVSGVSGVILSDTQIVPILASGSNVTFTSSYPILQYNSGEKLTYVSGDALFSKDYSGYNYEIYTYSQPQSYKNIRLDGITLPSIAGLNLNLFINGLLETDGVDFALLDDQVTLINPTPGEDNVLVASYSLEPTTTLNYTGQFPVNASGEVCVTGSGFSTGYDVFYNGQKYTKNWQFYTGTYSSQAAVIFYSGNAVTGSELKFYHVDDIPTIRTGVFATSTYKITGLTGYSEQIWLQGIYQTKGLDYYLTQPCFENYYFLSSLSNQLVYNNNDYYLNI